MSTITKKDLIDRIAQRTGNKRTVVKRVIQDFLGEIVRELEQGNRLEFRDFGVFESHSRASRIAQNPRTLERVYVPAKRTVKFKAGRVMRQRLLEAGAALEAGALGERASTSVPQAMGSPDTAPSLPPPPM